MQILRHETPEGGVVVRNYRYDADGQLLSEETTSPSGQRSSQEYSYDANGNLVGLETKRGKGAVTSHAWKYSDADHAVDYKRNQISHFPGDYDPHGRLVKDRSRNAYTYSSGGRDLLLGAKVDSTGLEVKYFYDSLGRLIGRWDSSGSVGQFFYSDPERPHLVTHAFRPREGALTSMVYDHQHRLVFAQVWFLTQFFSVSFL